MQLRGVFKARLDLEGAVNALMGCSAFNFFARWSSRMGSEVGVVSGGGRLPLFF
jgi:hypothetical protein